MIRRALKSFVALLLSAGLASASPAALPFPGPGGLGAGTVPLAAPVGIGTNSVAAGASSFTVTTTGAIPAGSTPMVAIMILKSTAISVSSVSDGTNTYVLGRTSTWDINTFVTVEIWYKANASAVGSGATITINLSAATSNGDSIASAFYVTGVLTASPLDKVNSGTGVATTTPASGSTGTLTISNEIAIGAVGGYAGGGITATWTESTGFTLLSNNVANTRFGLHVGYQIVSATTALNYQPVASSNFTYGDVIATFKGN